MSACRVVVIRPEPGYAATVAAARALRLTAIGAPLFRIEPVAWAANPKPYDALLLGSANAVRHAGAGLAGLAHLPVYAVGQATAEAARAVGFSVAAEGSGGLQELMPKLAADRRRRVLRLAGEEHLPVEPPAGVTIDTLVVYAARPLPLSDEARRELREGPVVLLHSAAAARHLAELCTQDGIDRATIALACLGPRIAEAAGAGWREVGVASRPDNAALLALAARMCQSAAVRVDDNNTIG